MIALDVAASCCTKGSGYVSVEAARMHALRGVVAVNGEEIVKLRGARGRVTASAVVAPHALPPFDQSAMDGFAVRSHDFINGSATLPILARQTAGPKLNICAPNIPAAVRIFTGAPMPAGFDAVVKQEHCTYVDGTVAVARRPSCGENIRLSGEDVPAATVIVEADTTIDARHISILAAAGVPALRVRRKIRVAVLSTGNELREPHEPIDPGEIHDSNRAMLLSLLDEPAIELTDFGRIADDPITIAKVFTNAADKFDVILSTGGVSVGEEDHISTAVAMAGGAFVPLRAAIKPGKPASIGHLRETNLIALPGNPVAALVTFLWFARPIVMRRMGLGCDEPRPTSAIAGFNENRRPGRDEFIPVTIMGRAEKGPFVIERRRCAGSARLSSLLDADGLARIPGDLTAVTVGDLLDLYLFEGTFSL